MIEGEVGGGGGGDSGGGAGELAEPSQSLKSVTFTLQSVCAYILC